MSAPEPGMTEDVGNTAHRFEIRVYYEDTDLGEVVYYANYLKFIERARTEWLRAYGVDQLRLKTEAGRVFVVRRCLIDYLKPARMDDVLSVRTTLTRSRGASLDLAQTVFLADRPGAPTLEAEVALVEAEVRIACVDAAGRPSRLPAFLAEKLAQG